MAHGYLKVPCYLTRVTLSRGYMTEEGKYHSRLLTYVPSRHKAIRKYYVSLNANVYNAFILNWKVFGGFSIATCYFSRFFIAESSKEYGCLFVRRTIFVVKADVLYTIYCMRVVLGHVRCRAACSYGTF